MHRFLCTLLAMLANVTLGIAVASETGDPLESLPLSEVRAGQTGFGLSVFSGHSPERFEVEVLGVWRDVQPDTSFILARLSGMNLEESGVVAGMSGSPVYLDGKLAGAVAFAWPFSIHPVAGITPIDAMRRLGEGGEGQMSASQAGKPATLTQLVSAELPRDLLDQGLKRLSLSPVEGAATGVSWSASGFGAASRELLAKALGPVSASGRSDNTETLDLVAGDSVAAVLVGGDMQLAATGTVTDRTGDQILAFGHPFLGAGPISVPMATSEVITVLANQANSFKIANLGAVVGTFDLDRKSGIRGQVGKVSEVTPLTIDIVGDRSRTFHLDVARLPMMTPTLVAISIMGALDSVTQAGGDQGLDLKVHFDLGLHGELGVDQSFDGSSASFEAALYVLAYTDYLANNYLETVEIAAIQVELTQHPRPRLATMIEAHASSTQVRPGDTVSLNLDLAEYRGGRRRVSMEVEIPTSIPEGRYSLLVGDGVNIDVARLTIQQTQPVTFSQALTLLESLHSRRELVVLGVFSGRGLAIAGEVLPRLPASVRSLWGAASSSSAIPLQLAIADQQVMMLDIPVMGAARIDLEIRRDGPLVPDEATPSERPTTGGSAKAGEGEPMVKEDSL